MVDETDEPNEPNQPANSNPTKDQPLHGPRRPRVSPVLWLIGLVVVLVLLYFLGVQFLVPAD